MKKINIEIWPLFWTQFFGALNDNVFKNALIIMITYQGISLFGVNSQALVAVSGAIFIFPFFFLSAVSGQMADRFEKTSLVKIIKKIEVLISFLAVWGLYQNNYPVLFLVLFLLGLHSTFFGPLKYALIPYYSKNEDLVFSNALISSGTFVAILLGTILGGLAVSNHENVWGLKLLLILFSTSGLYFSKKLKKESETDIKSDETKVNWNLITSSKDILSLVFKNSLIGILVVGVSWFWFLGAGLLTLMPLISKNIFNGNEHVATLFLFVFTLGMGVGPFILEKITSGRVYRYLIPLSLIALTFFVFDLSVVLKIVLKSFQMKSISSENQLINHAQLSIREFFRLDWSIRFIFDLLSIALLGGCFTVPQFAELQRITSHLEISRIVAGNNILNAFAMVLVSILLMILLQIQCSLSAIFQILGFLNLIISIILIYFYRSEFNKIWRF